MSHAFDPPRQDPDTATLFLMVGLPGAGKTTRATEVAVGSALARDRDPPYGPHDVGTA